MDGYEKDYNRVLAEKLNVSDLSECFYFPKYFTIETSNNCNARCIMCPKGKKGLKERQFMGDALFDKIVSEIQGYHKWIEMICLNSDGEPLLDREIASKIRKLKGIGIKHVNISTNAQLLEEAKIQELLESGLDDIRISMDGHSKETFEKVRRGLDFEVVKGNVLKLIQMRDRARSSMEIRVRMVELEENIGERKEWLDFWKDKVGERDKVQLMPMHSWSGKILDEGISQIEYYADKPCISVFSSFTINYDGIVQLCDSDIEQQMVMGDVKEASIQEIWQGEKFEYARSLHANAERNRIQICQGCDHWSRDFKETIS